jgi:predicted glycogen debranching enzyme
VVPPARLPGSGPSEPAAPDPAPVAPLLRLGRGDLGPQDGSAPSGDPFERALDREWLEVDGRGGYAMGTVPHCPTRRFHGLLVARPDGVLGPHGAIGRHLLLARLGERVVGPAGPVEYDCARYPGAFAPAGHRQLERFELLPWPRWTYRLGAAELTRELLFDREGGDLLVRYRLAPGAEAVILHLRPLLAFRRADALTFENSDLDPRAEVLPDGIRVEPYRGLGPLELRCGGSGGPVLFRAEPVWYRQVELAEELARGYEGHEDHFSPGELSLALPAGGEVVLAAGAPAAGADVRARFRRATAERRAAARDAGPGLIGRLTLAAESFLYRDGGRSGVLAGFPWFGEWGRDTFIALPGLTLARDRLDQCAEVLEGALPYLRDGQLPNIYGRDADSSQYGSADAALWFARAVRLYELAGGDRGLLDRSLLPALHTIAEALLDGGGLCTVALGLRVDEQGLLHAGFPGLNATWMDARVDGQAVTPRCGCPVELNALWYHLVAYLEHADLRHGDRRVAERWAEQRRRAGEAFQRCFWLESEGYLADVWSAEGVDRSVRPNMVLAASLEFTPLRPEQRADVVLRAERELLTPAGLRTLSPADPRYVGRYAGSMAERDRAYHQGTVWPWLIGPYVEAWLRAFGTHAAGRRQLRALVGGFEAALDRHGLGQLSEVADGDWPHTPGGTPAQAWSVGECLRALRLFEGLPQ